MFEALACTSNEILIVGIQSLRSCLNIKVVEAIVNHFCTLLNRRFISDVVYKWERSLHLVKRSTHRSFQRSFSWAVRSQLDFQSIIVPMIAGICIVPMVRNSLYIIVFQDDGHSIRNNRVCHMVTKTCSHFGKDNFNWVGANWNE